MHGQRIVVVLLAVVSFAIIGVDGFCYRKNPPKSQETLQQPSDYSIWVCVQSKNFVGDLDKAPVRNITQVWMSMSLVEKLNNNQFAKLANKLIKIEIWGSKLAQIEDNALHGLRELKGLILPRNELTTIKSAWFKDTPKLLELNLMFNRIQSIEVGFLKLVPALISLDLRGNELVSIPPDFVKQLPASLRRLNLFNNPLNYRQMMEAVDWSKSKEDKTNEPKLRELKYVLSVTKACIDDKAIVDKTNEAIDKCVEDRLSNELDAATGGDAAATTAANTATTDASSSSSSIAAAGSTTPSGFTTPSGSTTPAST